jgi:hypothetical protein
MKLTSLLTAVLLLAGIAVFSFARIQAQTAAPQNCAGYGMMSSAGPGMMGGQGYGMMQGMHGPADQAYMQSMRSMHRGMYGHAFTGDADHDFMVMMIPHHQAAIDMAQTELTYGKNPKLRAMAQSIIKTQQAEINQMNALLR